MKAVFNVATPNMGTELADWAFGPGWAIARKLGLLTPAVDALRTEKVAAFRAKANPILSALNIPFYTMSGNTFRRHPISLVTGSILASLAPGDDDDRFVTRARTRLPLNYGIDLGDVFANHFDNDTGHTTFPKISAQLTGLALTSPDFRRIVVNGFDRLSPDGASDARFNTWMWSTAWFKGKLSVGTDSAVQCATIATSEAQTDNDLLYPPIVGDSRTTLAISRSR